MTLFLTVLHLMVCFVLVVSVLLQRGKGAEIGAVFGGGASNTVFGSRGAGNLLTRLTTGCAIVFMLTSLSLSYLATNRANQSIFEQETGPVESETFVPPEAAPGDPAGGFEEVETAPEASAPGLEPAAAQSPAEGTAEPPSEPAQTP